MKGPLYMVVGENGLRAISRDGLRYDEFEQLHYPPSLTHGFFGNGIFVALGSAKFGTAMAVCRTRNGTDWDHEVVEGHGRAHGGFVLDGKIFAFVGIGDRGLRSESSLIWSADGKSWSERISLGHAEIDANGKNGPIMKTAAVGRDRVVAVGDYGRRMLSLDGLHWQDAQWHPKEPAKRLSLISIAYGNGLWVAGGLHGVRVASSDGMNWGDPIAGLEGEHINNIFHDGERFVCVGLGATYFSPDGKTWERKPNRDAPPLMTFGGGKYVGFKWPSRMFISEDSLEWQQVAELKHEAGGISFGA